jgi:hypothetical protein
MARFEPIFFAFRQECYKFEFLMLCSGNEVRYGEKTI